LGDCWEKIYLLLTPSKYDGRVPSQQGAPRTCNLTCRDVSQQTYGQTLLASSGVVIREIKLFIGGGGEGAVFDRKLGVTGTHKLLFS